MTGDSEKDTFHYKLFWNRERQRNQTWKTILALPLPPKFFEDIKEDNGFHGFSRKCLTKEYFRYLLLVLFCYLLL